MDALYLVFIKLAVQMKTLVCASQMKLQFVHCTGSCSNHFWSRLQCILSPVTAISNIFQNVAVCIWVYFVQCRMFSELNIS